MNWVDVESLNFLLMCIAMEELGVSEEAAARFARIATANVTGFFLRFDNVPDCLKLRDIKLEDGRFIVEWESTSTHAACPECRKDSEMAFSSHLRSEMVQDVGISGTPLWHRIWRKQYVCTNDHCIHKRFLEGFPGFIETRYSRMTVNLADRIIMVAKDTSDRAAARILNDEGSKIDRGAIDRLVLRRGGKQIVADYAVWPNVDHTI